MSTALRNGYELRSRAHRGLTMVELLVTIVIIGLLASTVLFAMTSATEAARAARTRSTIAKLHALLMERWESYRTRRVSLPPHVQSLSSQQKAAWRLKLIREVMMLELPDRWREVVLDKNDPWQPQKNNPDYPVQSKLYKGGERPALSRAYLNRYLAISQGSSDMPTIAFENAECLYLIITIGTGDGDALAQFSESDIGDVDEDGALEFLDGWGNPIRFLRWPAGFPSELHDVNTQTNQRDHDPFDPFHVDPDGYLTVPLIYSAGADEGYDVAVEWISNNSEGFAYATRINPNIPGIQFIDPYAIINPGDPSDDQFKRGRPMDVDKDGESEWVDNIHNHLMGLR